MTVPQPILLTHWRSPGDIVCFTGAVRDLMATNPGRFAIHVGGSCAELWENNPHVEQVWGMRLPRKIARVSVSYRAQLAVADQMRLHFLTAFHHSLSEQLGVAIPVLQPHGDLHLSEEERTVPLVAGRYWYFVAGGKSDIVTKIWPAEYSQQLVSLLASRGLAIVQGGADFPGHWHPALNGVQNLVGKTSLRDVLRLIYHAEGVISPVTFAMHVAAAFQKPCVVIAGGREPYWWEAYTNNAEQPFGAECAPVKIPHRFLHSQGSLDCCRDGGCWKTQARSSQPWGTHDCVQPSTQFQEQVVPTCLAAITPEIVADAVMSYYREGTLRPV